MPTAGVDNKEDKGELHAGGAVNVAHAGRYATDGDQNEKTAPAMAEWTTPVRGYGLQQASSLKNGTRTAMLFEVGGASSLLNGTHEMLRPGGIQAGALERTIKIHVQGR